MSDTRTITPRTAERALIAVIEDDDEFRDMVVAELNRHGYDAIGYGSGFEFIASWQMEGRKPDAVISDIRMPGVDGIDLIDAIRKAKWTTPVILMTGYGAEEAEREIEQHDAVAVMTKPFAMRDLERIVDAVVGIPFGLAEPQGQAAEPSAQSAHP